MFYLFVMDYRILEICIFPKAEGNFWEGVFTIEITVLQTEKLTAE